MNRSFLNWNVYLNKLLVDDYPSPADKGHTRLLRGIIHEWISKLKGVTSVLDVGCGDAAIAEPFFRNLGIEYTGIALGLDAHKHKKRSVKAINADFSFLEEFADNSFDLIFSRHSLEHSPAPLLTLMEWHRVSQHFLCLVLPNPDHWGRTGLNHYSCLYDDQWKFLAERAGWGMIWNKKTDQEYWFMFEKKRIYD